jgi:uncharacterized membrane protein
MHQSVIVNATSESVAYKYIPCNLEVPEIKERCLNTRRKLASALSYDVSISKEYEDLYWASKKEYYKDSVISKFLMTPIVMSPEEQKLKEAEFKKRQAERQENHNARIAVIGWILLIISVLGITAIISIQLMLWLPTVSSYISFIYSYIHYRIYGIEKNEENDEDNQQKFKQ